MKPILPKSGCLSLDTVDFRELTPLDQAMIWDLLLIALWDPPPATLRPRAVLDHPDVRIYAENWGRVGDVGVVMVDPESGRDMGACWLRLLTDGRGLAWVDERTPQLGIALFPEYQGKGYGGRLLRTALRSARDHGYARVSLTVHPLNPAVTLYQRCGFRAMGERNRYLLMTVQLESDGNELAIG